MAYDVSKGAYAQRGVSATKDEVHAAIRDEDMGVFPGAFCKMIKDPAGDDDFCAAMHADGAGTKSSLAYLAFRESGDYSWFAGTAQDSAAMNLDDLLCVGACGGFVMSNTIGRNAHRVDGKAISAVIGGYRDFCSLCEKYGVDITMSGGETADVGDLVGTLVVDSTVFVRMRRADVIDCKNIVPGDVIVGLSSFGHASYEKGYNAGMGSNGLTAARHMLLSHGYAAKYPETYSPTVDEKLVYCGRYALDDTLPGTDVSVGEAILSPTRTYAPVMKKLLSMHDGRLHGAVHCTGGGQAKCKNFGSGLHYIKDALFDRPPLFEALAGSGQMDEGELYRVFNMGHRMEIYCAPDFADTVIAAAQSFGVDAKIVGRTEESCGGNRVTIIDRGNTFVY